MKILLRPLALFLCVFALGLATVARSAPLRRPVTPQQPMWLVHIDTWNYADPQKIIALIPADIRPFVVMNISLSISHNETTSQFQVAEYGYEIAKSWLRACAENRMWAMVQPSSGGYAQFSDFDLSVYEEFYRDYPNFIGFNYAEQFWGYDSPTDPLSATWSDRINHFANLLALSNRYGGYLVVSWCGNQWSPNINPIGMLKRVPAFAAACRDYTENYILCEKYTQQSYQSDMESLCLGAWLSGYSGQYGIRYDDTGWTDSAGAHESFTMATYGAPFLEHVMLTGQTVIDAPELIWTQCFQELGAASTTDGYSMRRWGTFPQFDNVSVDLFRKVLDGTVRIPSRREVIDRTKVAVINNVNSGSNDTIYSTPDTLFEGLYRMDGDGNLLNNKSFFKKTGRYPTVPTVFALDDADANSFQVKLNRTAYSTRWPTVAAKVAEFDSLFPQEYTGDLYAGRHENGWVVYNPFKTGQTASASIPFKYNTAERMELTFSQYTAGVVKEYADRVTYYLSNYDNVLDTGLKTDVIAIHGASAEPTYTFADRGSHQASVVTKTWADGVLTLTIQHNGPLDLTVNCAGAATGRLTAYTPSAIAAPAAPPAFAGPRQYEAECFDYKNVGAITKGGNNGAIRNYTGQGYLQFGNGASAAVRDTVSVLRPGAYRLETRYAVTGADISSVDLYVNGARVSTPAFAQTATLSDWAVNAQTVNLVAGANTVEFRATATRSTSLYFDSIVVRPTSFEGGIVVQENEAGFVGVDGAVASTRVGYTGEGYADTADAAGAGITWKLNFPSATTGSFTFRYAAAEDRAADLLVNGVVVAPGVRFPATGSSSDWDLVTAHASVPAGTVAVSIRSVSDAGLPDIDFLGVGGETASGTLSPAADTYVRDGGSAASNFGSATQLVAKYDATANSGFTRVSYLKFDVGALANAASVKLKLVPFQVDGSATLSFERIADDTWSESAMTWNTRPTAAGVLAATASGYAVGQQIEIDLTDAVKTEAAGDGILSLRVTNDGWNFIGFHSRESATEAFRPVLEYTVDVASVTPAAVEIAHLRFDEGAGATATDSSGHGHDGALAGTPSWVSGAAARVNGALLLGGGSHVALPLGVVSALDDDFSVSFWYKPAVLAEGARVFDFSTGTAQNSLSFAPLVAGGVMRFSLVVNGVAQTLDAPSSPAFAVGAWTHVALVVDDGVATIYIDGVAASSASGFTHAPADLGPTTANFIGRSASAAPALEGTVDEFQIQQGALLASDVALLATPPAAPTDLGASSANGRVVLAWNAVSGATVYTISRSTSASGPFVVVGAVAGVSFTDTAVVNDTRYYYRITASNGVAAGSESTAISATPSAVHLHLPFDQTTGASAPDASGHGRAGAITGTSSWTSGANARLGSALRLSGGHAALPVGVVSTLADCTVAFWVKLDTVATWARVFDFNNGTTSSSMYFVPRTSGGLVRFGLNGQNLEAPAAVQFSANVWTHVAITLSGDTATIYLNGATVATGTSFTNNPSGLGATPYNYLGRSASSADPTLAGTLDEFVIYDAALDAAQIAALAAVPVAPGDLAAIGGDSSVSLDWTPLVGASAYTVQRAPASAGPWTSLATLAGSVTAYLDAAVTPGDTYHYRVAIADGVGTGSISATVSAQPVNRYAAWSADVFAGATDPAIVGATADPDGDGLANLLEYAFASDPLINDAAGASPSVSTDGAGNLIVEFRQIKGADDLTLVVQTSPDLAAWTDSAATPELIADEGAYLRLRVSIPLAGQPRLFARLSVVTP